MANARFFRSALGNGSVSEGSADIFNLTSESLTTKQITQSDLERNSISVGDVIILTDSVGKKGLYEVDSDFRLNNFKSVPFQFYDQIQVGNIGFAAGQLAVTGDGSVISANAVNVSTSSVDIICAVSGFDVTIYKVDVAISGTAATIVGDARLNTPVVYDEQIAGFKIRLKTAAVVTTDIKLNLTITALLA